MTTNSAKKRATQKKFRLTKKSAFKLAKKVVKKVVPVAKKVVKKGLSFQRKTTLAGLILDPLPQGLGKSTNKKSKVVNMKKKYDKEMALIKRVRNMKKKGSKK